MPPGTRHGMLVVVRELPTVKGKSRCLCRCDCGTEVEVNNYDLRSGNTMSCGCLQRKRTSDSNRTHGGSRTRLYHIWTNMKERCYWSSWPTYENYGARGIRMCPEWKNDFAAFRSWALSHGYDKTLTIERKDVDLGYSPDNCCWIPRAQQAKNRTMNRYVTIDGETMCLAEAARLYGVRPTVAQARVRTLRWDPIKAVSTPVRAINNKQRTRNKEQLNGNQENQEYR